MKFFLSWFTLVFALSGTTVVFAADIVELEDGSFVDRYIKTAEKDAVNFTSNALEGLPSPERSSCEILSHTSYSSPSGSACVRCGDTLVAVNWVTYNGTIHYSGHPVGACPRSLETGPVQVGNGVLTKTINLEILK